MLARGAQNLNSRSRVSHHLCMLGILNLARRLTIHTQSSRIHMFSSQRLFQTLSCPEGAGCTRPGCIFSHRTDLPAPIGLSIPIHDPMASSSKLPATQRTSPNSLKRPVPISPSSLAVNPTGEPPRKLQKLGVQQRPLAVSNVSHTNVSV